MVQEKPITDTVELAEIIKAAHPRWEKHKHPATRCFQALRIFINRELDHRGLPVADNNTPWVLKKIGGAIRPGSEEVSLNPRARSSVMRIAQRMA